MFVLVKKKREEKTRVEGIVSGKKMKRKTKEAWRFFFLIWNE